MGFLNLKQLEEIMYDNYGRWLKLTNVEKKIIEKNINVNDNIYVSIMEILLKMKVVMIL